MKEERRDRIGRGMQREGWRQRERESRSSEYHAGRERLSKVGLEREGERERERDIMEKEQ